MFVSQLLCPLITLRKSPLLVAAVLAVSSGFAIYTSRPDSPDPKHHAWEDAEASESLLRIEPNTAVFQDQLEGDLALPFQLVNSGAMPIVVEWTETSCSCTKLTLSSTRKCH